MGGKPGPGPSFREYDAGDGCASRAPLPAIDWFGLVEAGRG